MELLQIICKQMDKHILAMDTYLLAMDTYLLVMDTYLLAMDTHTEYWKLFVNSLR